MPLDLNIAYNTLVANPAAFLKNYTVRITGSVAPSNPNEPYFLLNLGVSRRPGKVLGTARMHATESFQFRSAAGMLGILPAVARKPVTAQTIHMDPGMAAMHFFTLGVAGSNIMVTGQLSGCAFIMQPGAAPGTVDVAHVRPVGVTPPALAANVAAANPAAQVYGATATTGNYDVQDRRVSIIGVRNRGEWRIYAQKQDSRAADYQIKSVYQIWPSRRKM